MSGDIARLPVTLTPAWGEALDGYLERIADANHLTTATLMHLAFAGEARRFLVVKPSRPVLARLATLAGCADTDLTAATLSGLDDSVIDLTGLDSANRYSYRTVAARGWAAVHGTQICPHCLAADGIWRLWWRLPYAVICATHGAYLLTQCPGCGRPFRDQRHSVLRPVGASEACGNPIGAGPRKHCRTTLTDFTTTAAPPDQVAVQRRIDTALAGAPVQVLGADIAAGEYLRELRALTVLLLHLATQPRDADEPAWVDAVQHAAAKRAGDRGPRWGLRPPDDPAARGGAFAAADTVLTAPELETAAMTLTPWLDRVPRVPDGTLVWLADRTQMTSTLSDLIIHAHAPHRRLSHLLDETRELVPAVFVPQVIPADIYDRHLTALFDSAPDTVRLFAAICLARAAVGVSSWADVGDVLRLPAGMAERTARACSARALVPPRHVIDTLVEVAEDLPHIDRRALETDVIWLRRRRTWFSQFCAIRPGTLPSSKGYAITWIWVDLAGGHLLTSPGWTDAPTRQRRALYRQFANSLTPALEQFLSAVLEPSITTPHDPAPVIHSRSRRGALPGGRGATVDRHERGAL